MPAKPGRDRLLLRVGYFGGLRVTELITWDGARSSRGIAARRSWSSSAKATKCGRCCCRRRSPSGCWPAGAMHCRRRRCSTRRAQPGRASDRQGSIYLKRAAKRAGVNPAASAHWMRHAPRQPRHRPRRAGHAGVGDAGPCGSENDSNLCPRPTGRVVGSVSRKSVKGRVRVNRGAGGS